MDLYCDVIETIESKEGLTWIYMKIIILRIQSFGLGNNYTNV